MRAERHGSLLASALVYGCLTAEGLLLVAHLVNHVTLDNRLIDFDQESNLPTWLSSSQFLLAAAAALIAVGAADRRVARFAWLGVATLATAMSIDEAAALHEAAGSRLGERVTLSLMQPLLAVTVVAFLLTVATVVPRRPAAALGAACGTLVVSQACASVAGLALNGDAVFGLETVEDLTETLTATLLLVAGLEAGGVRIQWRPRLLAAELRAWWTGPGARGL